MGTHKGIPTPRLIPGNLENSKNYLRVFERKFDRTKKFKLGLRKHRLKHLSNLIFCFKSGGLINAFFVEESFVIAQKVDTHLIKFYSTKMLVLHASLLMDSYEERTTLVQAFKKTHPYNSFGAFLDRDFKTRALKLVKFAERQVKRLTKKLKKSGFDTSNLELNENDSFELDEMKREFLNWELERSRFKVKKTVILTHSFNIKHAHPLLDPAFRLEISDINEKGTVFLEEQLRAFLSPECTSTVFVVEFNRIRLSQHFNYVKNLVDQSIDDQIAKVAQGSLFKQIILVFSKPMLSGLEEKTNVRDVDYFKDKWEYQVIDSLEESHYDSNIEYLFSTSRQIVQRMVLGFSDLTNRLFFKSLEELNIDSNCERYIREALIPVLSRQAEAKKRRQIEEENNKNQDEEQEQDEDKEQEQEKELDLEAQMKMLDYLDSFVRPKPTPPISPIEEIHSIVMQKSKGRSIPSWRETLFQNTLIYENYFSIEDVVVFLMIKDYRFELSRVVRVLIHHASIGTLLTLENLPLACRSNVRNFFVREMKRRLSKEEELGKELKTPGNFERRRFLVPFFIEGSKDFKTVFGKKIDSIRRSRRQIYKSGDHRGKYEQHLEEMMMKLDKKWPFLKVLGDAELLETPEMLKMLFRDFFVQKFYHEESFRDFESRDDYSQKKEEEAKEKEKQKAKEENQKKEKRKLKEISEKEDRSENSRYSEIENENSNSDEEENDDEFDYDNDRTNLNKMSMINFKNYDANDDTKQKKRPAQTVIKKEPSVNEEDSESRRDAAKPFMVELCERVGEMLFQHIEKSNQNDPLGRNQKIFKGLVLYVSMLNLTTDYERLRVLDEATRHVRFEGAFGVVVAAELAKYIAQPEELFLGLKLIVIIIISLFNHLHLIFYSARVFELQGLLRRLTKVHQEFLKDRSLRRIIEEMGVTIKVKNIAFKLETLSVLASIYKKGFGYVHENQFRQLCSAFWQSDHPARLFCEDLAQVQEELKKFGITDLNPTQKGFRANGSIDLFGETESLTGARVKPLRAFKSKIHVKKDSDDEDAKDEEDIMDMRESSLQYNSLAERMLFLGLELGMAKHVIFQRMNFLFFKIFILGVLNYELDYQEEEMVSQKTPGDMLFRVFVELSENKIDLASFIIQKVKGTKSCYRQILSWSKLKSGEGFMTVLVDKLTQNQIVTLGEEKGQILKYVERDLLKQSEVEVLKVCLGERFTGNAKRIEFYIILI